MTAATLTLVRDAWLGLVAYWIISARNLKPIRVKASLKIKIIQLLFLVPGCVLLFSRVANVGPLHHGLLPDSKTVTASGVALTFVGVAVAIWARYCLGGSWTAQVAIREDHTLVQAGPYRWIRHPIYTGILTAIIGTAVVVSQVGALIGAALIAMGLFYKAKQEERRLVETFGNTFVEHRKRTGMLLPKFF
jgi:protein-S-isoprenylcysteine O-methyltransferase Ste14